MSTRQNGAKLNDKIAIPGGAIIISELKSET